MENQQKASGEDALTAGMLTDQQKATTTFNMDTGKREPLTPTTPGEDEGLMDFASGSGGGSGGDGGAS